MDARLELREVGLDAAPFAADLWTELNPDEPRDPEEVANWWRTNSENPLVAERRRGIWIDGHLVGIAQASHHTFDVNPERFGRLYADLLPAVREAELLDGVYEVLEEDLRADTVARVTTTAMDHDTFKTALLRARGYARDRVGLRWQLDLRARRPALEALAAASRARMREQGIQVLTFDMIHDAERWRRLHALVNEAGADIPSTEPEVPDRLETFMTWIRGPGRLAERIWVAREGDEIVGVSYLHYPPVRGHVWTDFTGVARAARGRGIAMAVKLETLLQAVELGVPSVRTENDAENAPILRINAQLGYMALSPEITFLKSL